MANVRAEVNKWDQAGRNNDLVEMQLSRLILGQTPPSL
jgi:hypothetical protein